MEIHERLGIPKASLSGLLKVLVARRYLELNGANRYMPSIRLMALGSIHLGTRDLVELAEPTMEVIRDITLETVNLATLDGGDVVFVYKKVTRARLRYDVPVGWRMPAYGSSVGKAMLSTLGDEEIESFYPQGDLVGLGPNSLRTVEALKVQLQEIRLAGFATDHEEGLVGVHAVGSPILDTSRRAVAGLSVAFPKARYTKEFERKLAALVKTGARIISARLGYDTGEPLLNSEGLKEIWAG